MSSMPDSTKHDPDRLYPNPNGPNLPQVPGSWLFDNGNARDRKLGELEGVHPDTGYLFDLFDSEKRKDKKNQKFWREIYHPHYQLMLLKIPKNKGSKSARTIGWKKKEQRLRWKCEASEELEDTLHGR